MLLNNIVYRHGFTLIELLVAVFIFSIGLLGIATMHSLSLKEELDNSQRSQAVMMMQEITSRMRANTKGAYATDYKTAADTLDCAVQPAMMCSDYSLAAVGDGVNCTAAQLATYDLWELACGNKVPGVKSGSASHMLDQTLSIDCAAVEGSCPAGTAHTITINWRSKASEAVDQQAGQVQTLTQTVIM
ncbi:type IV pilus modification protein PilV [Sinobacterium caligoides]|uniref:Type IV pilus modification protein PilV n=1 Tax=Sinobacterium caligoides TaxID=933926 RepID=A0A3N2DLX2_9GAMM|nr:type IV pilus modification protein PilV [Sinobacterium caligoides]ROS00335.1 type IV pilus modification protein PilV [Sinobacterium caligoides]